MLTISLAIAFFLFQGADQSPQAAADEEKITIELSGVVGGPGLHIAESDKPVHAVELTAQLNRKGIGTGLLVLDISPRTVDEFGFPVDPPEPAAQVKLECALKLIKIKELTFPANRFNPMPQPEVWTLYSVTGPQIKSRMLLAAKRQDWTTAHFLIPERDSSGRFPVYMKSPAPQLFEPCHPGCFPVGTLIQVPGGTTPIELLRPRDRVTTIRADGKQVISQVESVFITRNRLIEVQTNGEILVTTETQPLALVNGELKGAGELQPGDRIQTWVKDQIQEVVVRAVKPTARREKVYNVVVGDTTLFIANGYLARSKPPKIEVLPAP